MYPVYSFIYFLFFCDSVDFGPTLLHNKSASKLQNCCLIFRTQMLVAGHKERSGKRTGITKAGGELINGLFQISLDRRWNFVGENGKRRRPKPSLLRKISLSPFLAQRGCEILHKEEKDPHATHSYTFIIHTHTIHTHTDTHCPTDTAPHTHTPAQCQCIAIMAAFLGAKKLSLFSAGAVHACSAHLPCTCSRHVSVYACVRVHVSVCTIFVGLSLHVWV